MACWGSFRLWMVFRSRPPRTESGAVFPKQFLLPLLWRETVGWRPHANLEILTHAHMQLLYNSTYEPQMNESPDGVRIFLVHPATLGDCRLWTCSCWPTRALYWLGFLPSFLDFYLSWNHPSTWDPDISAHPLLHSLWHVCYGNAFQKPPRDLMHSLEIDKQT
jgi:hypothetical protein